MERRWHRLAGAGAVLAVLVALLAVMRPGGDGSAEAATVTIDVGNTWFCNSSFNNGVCDTNISVGDTATWNFVSGFHNATECGAAWANASGCAGAAWFSPTGSSPFSWSRTFDTAGTFFYLCTVHPDNMRGRIIVQQAAPTSTNTPVPPTSTPTNTSVPPTATPTNTPVPPADTPTNTPVPPGATPTNTPVPPGDTPTNTPVPPGATPTDTPVSPGDTPTNTPVPPGATPTDTPVSPGDTPANTPLPPDVTPTDTPASPADTPTNTPVVPEATPVDPPASPGDTPTPVPSEPTPVDPPASPGDTPTDTPVLPGATATPLPDLLGNVNCDGRIDSVDALWVLWWNARMVDDLICPQNANVNGDGAIDADDAQLILQYSAGWLGSAFPVRSGATPDRAGNGIGLAAAGAVLLLTGGYAARQRTSLD